MKLFASIFIITLAISTLAGAEAPVLTIDSVEGNHGILTINYTVVDASGVELVTDGWQFSTDGGANWLDIDAVAIGNNDPKPAGSSFITWDTQAGANNLADKYYDSVSFRMFIKGGNIWKTKSPMPTERYGLAAVAVDGKIYAIGGYDGSYLRTVEEYDPSTDSWRTVAQMPTARYYLAAASVDGKIYAVGGVGSYLRTVEEYNPKTDKWRTVTQMPTERYGLAAASEDGKIYAIGGYDGSYLRTVEEYNPSTDSWRTVAQMPTARYDLAAASVDGKIYAFGGAGSLLRTVEEYDPSTDSWRTVAQMPTARRYLAAAAVDGKIYAVGGVGSYLRTVEEYDPKTDEWRLLAAMPTARYGLAAATVDGKIYAVGGHDGSYLRTVEEYTPPRESEIATSDSFAVANHIKAVIASPADGEFLFGVVDVMGTAMVTDGSLNSWILDFARGEHPPSGYTPITISSTPVEDGLLGTWDTTARDDGIYTLRLRVTDTNAITLETSVVVTLDNTQPDAPTVQINSPTGFNFIKSNATITISGSTETHATVKSAHLLDQTGAPFKDVTSDVVIDGSGVISGNVNVGELTGITALKLGLVVQDRANNPSPQGVSNGLTVDDDKPQVFLLSPANGAYFNKPPILFFGTAADAISGVAKVDIHTGFGNWTPVVGNVNWTYSYTPPSDDILLTVKARAKDKAGNEQITTSINVFYFSTLPTANISAPVDNAEVSGLVDILGDADDTDTDYSDFSYKLEYAEGADAVGGWQLIAELENTPVQNGLLAQWQTSPILPEGVYTLRLTVKNSQSQVEVKRRNIQVKTPPQDTIPPATVMDLVTSAPKSDSITLIWTAPGDDGNVGTATAYDVRYSDVIPFNWDTATKVLNPQPPQEPGLREEFIVTGLSPSTIYHFALKTVDEAGNWSDMSNMATGKTTAKTGDVSGDRTVSAYDAALILQYVVGLIGDFPVDLMMAAEKATPCNYILSIPDRSVKIGESIIVPIEINEASVLAGGMTLRYDSSVLRATKVGSEMSGVYWESNIADGQVRIAFARIKPSEGGSANLFYIKFDVISNRPGVTGKIEFSHVQLAESLSIATQNGSITILPTRTTLLPNYPNPFNPETWLPYQLAQDADVTILIYNINGQLVRDLFLGNQSAGVYVMRDKAAYWDGRDNSGEKVSSGVYFVTLRAGDFVSTRKMAILK